MQESEAQEQAAGVLERVRQTAMANFQLLVMLEVVREWTRADAVDLADAAQQTDAGTGMLEGIPGSEEDAQARTLARELVFRVQRKLDRLMQLAPVQSGDTAVVNALLEGLRRLHEANERVQAMLQSSSPLAGRSDWQSVPRP